MDFDNVKDHQINMSTCSHTFQAQPKRTWKCPSRNIAKKVFLSSPQAFEFSNATVVAPWSTLAPSRVDAPASRFSRNCSDGFVRSLPASRASIALSATTQAFQGGRRRSADASGGARGWWLKRGNIRKTFRSIILTERFCVH